MTSPLWRRPNFFLLRKVFNLIFTLHSIVVLKVLNLVFWIKKKNSTRPVKGSSNPRERPERLCEKDKEACNFLLIVSLYCAYKFLIFSPLTNPPTRANRIASLFQLKSTHTHRFIYLKLVNSSVRARKLPFPDSAPERAHFIAARLYTFFRR